MKLQGRNLKADMQGEDVKLLQGELRQLGFGIAEAEAAQNVFGETTRRAVVDFQKAQGLNTDGIVGENTAKLLSFEVGRLQRPPNGAIKPPVDNAPNSYVIQGQVRQLDGKPAVGLTVRAFNKDGGVSEIVLGESVTDQNGQYKITYAEEVFRRLSGARNGLDMVLRIIDPMHAMQQGSNAVRITRPVETINREVSWLPWTPPQPQPEPSSFRVEGQVRWFDGRQAANFTVRAFDRDLRSEEELGKAVTDKEGGYRINYSASQFRRAEKNGADLVVRVFGQKGESLLTSSIIFNAKPVEVVDLLMGGKEFRGPSEFQQLIDEIRPLLDGLAINELTEDEHQQDVTFLSGETGIDSEKITHFVVAHKLSERSGLAPEFWYSTLRGKLFSDPFSVASGGSDPEKIAQQIVMRAAFVSDSMIEYALRQSLAGNVIDERHADSIEDWLRRYRDFVGKQMLDSNGAGEQPELKDLLDLAGVEANARQQFVRHYFEGKADHHEAIERLRKDSALNPKEVGRIETVLLLDDLTLGHRPLVGTVAQSASVPSDVRELAKLRPEEWKTLLTKSTEQGATAAPEFVAGASPEEKANNYATLLTKRFQDAYPTAAFAGGLERARAAHENLALKHAGQLEEILKSHPEFELHTTAVELFINERADPATFNSTDKAGLIQEMKGVQRVFKIAPSFAATNTLLSDGIHSAQQVYRMGETKFVRKYADRPGFNEQSARSAYQRAANTQAAVVTLMGEVKAAENANAVQALAVNSTALGEFPNLQNLFGKVDICECEHCRSVYSPSAYFADVLRFLDARDSVAPPVSVKDILFERRPDIGFLELSCGNSNMPLPYIDLACEVLEDQVAPWHLFDLASTLEPSFVKGPASAGVKNAFSAATPSVKLSADATVSKKLKDKYWVVRDSDQTYQVTKAATALKVSVLRQAHGTAEELAANPEYVNEAAYTALKAAKYPFSLPFDFFTEELRAYLDKAHVKRADLMQVFLGNQAPNNATTLDIAAEYFGISKAEQSIILQADTTNQFAYWGEADNSTAVTEVGKVDVFLKKTGLEYNDILKLLSLKFINPDGSIKLVHLDSSCDTNQKRLQILNEAKLDRLHRFLRLWKKLGWKMWEVDLVITHPAIGNGSLDQPFIERLKLLVELKEKLPRLTIEQLCSFFGQIDTTQIFTESYQKPESSLYERLFLNKKLTNPVDANFAVAAVMVTAPTETLGAHLPPILSALGVKETDLNIFRGLKRPANGQAYMDDDKLSLKNLSFLYRHAQLSKLLKLKATEWQTLLYIAQLDVFQNPQVTLDFIDSVERLRASGFSLDELSYILTANLSAKAAQAEKNITLFLTNLRRELQKIAAENSPSNLPTDEEELAALLTAQLQKIGWDAIPTGNVLAILKNEFQGETTITTLPAGFDFPTAIKSAIQIRYDHTTHVMRFTGLMTNTEKTRLLNDAAIDVAVRSNVDYQTAINNFHAAPRLQLKFFKPEFVTPLAKLPAAISFKEQLPKELAAKVSYDVEQLQLRFAGIMTSAEKARLDNLSTDAAYRNAVQSLFNLPGSNSFTADELWLKDTDLATPLPNRLKINLTTAITKLLSYLKRTLSETLVFQQFSESLGVTPATAEKLLTTYKFFGSPSTHPLLEDFTGGPFPASDSAITYAVYKDRYDTYYWLHRVALIIKKMKMSFRELAWLISRHAQVEVLNLETLPLVYKETPPAVASLDEFFNLSDYMLMHHLYSDENVSMLDMVERLINDAGYTRSLFSADVELLTEWIASDINHLIGANVLNIAYPTAYLKIKNWKRLAKAVAIITKLNGSAQSVLQFASAAVGAAQSANVKQILRSKYENEQWLDISKGIQDQMRERKRESLVAYLLTQPMPADAPTRKWENANDLYAYYLIDVEMCSCQLTSRIVQASAAAQLFVQRSFMGLEPKVRVSVEEDDAWKQWKWMKNYRLWEANRKVFLYPENWIEPELRRDKSPFFKDLENELLQNDVNRDNVETAFLNYIEKLDGVAQLEIAGTFYQEDNHTLHVFARTPGSEPHTYYYRQWIDDRRWTPWSKVECDIKGEHLIPLVMEQRLYLVWPEFREEPLEVSTLRVPMQGDNNFPVDRPWKKTYVHLAISECRNKKWSPKKVSKDSVYLGQYQGQTFEKSGCVLLPLDFTDLSNGKFLILVDINQRQEAFELLGCKGYPEKYDVGLKLNLFITRFDRDELKYLKNAETDLGDPLVPHYNLVLLRTILNKTPDFFKITYPLYMSYFDKLFFLYMYLLAALQDNASISSRRLYLTLGTFYNWFYTDKSRNFFVRPQLVAQQGSTLYYKELVAYFKELIELLQAGKLDELYDKLLKSYQAQYQLKLTFQNFYHPFTCLFAKQLYNKGVDGLISRETQFADNHLDFRDVYGPTAVVRENYPQEVVDFAPDGSYSQYNWELFFHAPLMIAMRLSKNQRFEEAMQWFHYIFDPTGAHDKDPITGNPATVPQKYWITKQFYQTTSQGYSDQRIDNILRMLANDPANPPDPAVKDELVRQVADWRANPYDPHLIAQFRTVAYQKTTVMKYIDNLVAWGDQLFRQDTMESVNEAAQLYIQAAEILGPRPRKIAPARKPAVETFNELEESFDDFSNAVVNFENLIPVVPDSTPQGPDGTPLPTLLYFCIPQNDKLLSYWDMVADRLYKIRHCLNIEGVFRQLSLFAPPIDPAVLVKAVAAGVDISSALSDLNAPLPHYRFSLMLQKANEVTNDVKALGNALLSALEKKDAEALSLLRQSHEMKVLQAMKTVKEQQIEDARLGLEGLKKNKEVITTRRDYYQKIERINASENLHQEKLYQALIAQQISQSINIAASVAHVVPSFSLGVSGFGGSPKAGIMFGGPNIGSSLQATAGGFTVWANAENYNASKASINAGHERRWDDWKLQEKLANKELEQVDKQIAAAELKIKIAESELKNQELQIENSKAIDEYLRGKYTNQELYEWMIGQISQVYFQSYQLAYDLAKRAEKCFQYELGIENSSYIQFGYWDSLRKGLLSGEKLQYDLRRLDAAYIEQNRREFELTKHISLALVNPPALLQLKETGVCFFDLPEELFDLDYQGHYFRRIKSVSISIPCVAGPHTTVNATLRLVKNSVRVNTQAGDQYEHNHEDGVFTDDARFRESHFVSKSIATSSGQNDGGMFDLNFRDERYLPFEGAGAISTWKLELTVDKELRQFDHDSISDVIMHLRYTAREDAGTFRTDAADHLKTTIAQAASELPLRRLFNLKHEFPTEWHAFFHPATGANKELLLRLREEHFPFFSQEKVITVAAISIYVQAKSTEDFKVKLEPPLATPPPETPDANQLTLTQTLSFGELYWCEKSDLAITFDETVAWRMRMKKASGTFDTLVEDDVKECFMVIEYNLH